jgi:hypothetical protein
MSLSFNLYLISVRRTAFSVQHSSVRSTQHAIRGTKYAGVVKMSKNSKSPNMSYYISSLFVLAMSIQCFASPAASLLRSKTAGEIVYLSGQGKDDAVPWEFYCTGGSKSGSWMTIPVPSNWEFQGFGNYNYGSEKQKSNEQGRYRKTFNVPRSWQNKRIFIVFEGVMTDTEVMVNGKSAGPIHQGGFYRFKYEITDLVKTGENLLEVTVSKVSSNRTVEQAERQADYWVFGGIYRPVYLEVVPQEFIEWTAVDARANGNFSIDVHLNGLNNANLVRAVISQLNGQQLGEPFEAKLQPGQEKVTLKTKTSEQKLWTSETPNLYQVQVALLQDDMNIHTVQSTFGFRTFEVRAGDGLYLNGQKIRLKGVDRHSFRPDSGRCLSRQDCYDDVLLIKQMNMNAVRMSHYPPDTYFLEACDKLGLYVLDELAGWQKPPYDTDVGKKLVREMVMRDASHPCILFWDNGNEGGWNTDLDEDFALYDPQKRIVLHPWENFGGIDTDHYESYESTLKKLSSYTLFMPTEFLHGLYDGGLGAGLKDYWDAMGTSPMGAGGFLWVFADEGAVRTDREGRIDVAGNQAPDGIVGPYHEKEASFYSIKEIWSPLQITPEKLPEDFNGTLTIENHYDFTNLNACTFDLRLCRFPEPQKESSGTDTVFQRSFAGPDVAPHDSGSIDLSLPYDWRQSQVLYLTAKDPAGNEIWTWSWDIDGTDYYQQKLVSTTTSDSSKVGAFLQNGKIHIDTGGLALQFDAKNGLLTDITVKGIPLSFSGGPTLIGGTVQKPKVTCRQIDNHVVLNATYEDGMNYARWTIYPTGWIELEYELKLDGLFYIFGVNFDYPENKMRQMRWLGRGPYRVWKNRLQGGRLDIFSNPYKDDVPGATWDFPEFKGYYQDWRWVVFSTEEGDITIVNGSDDLYLGVYRPNNGQDPMRTRINVPETGISFLHGIPAIGTKGQRPEDLGPQGQRNRASGTYKGKVYFHFGK